MSPTISPPAPGLTPSGRELASTPAGSAPARGELSATRPLPPVSNPATTLDARFLTARDRPVGPPPAFKVSLLQHILETNLRPDPLTKDSTEELDMLALQRTPQGAAKSSFTLPFPVGLGDQVDMKL